MKQAHLVRLSPLPRETQRPGSYQANCWMPWRRAPTSPILFRCSGGFCAATATPGLVTELDHLTGRAIVFTVLRHIGSSEPEAV